MTQPPTRREFLAQLIATGVAGTAALQAEQNQNPKDKPMSPIRLEAKHWSELPAALAQYEAMLDKETAGVSRIFGYASLVKQHDNEKPAGSKSLPNQRAQVRGMEVAMNVLAAGEWEFRGTRGTYRNEGDTVIQEGEGAKGTPFASVGIYAGLESLPAGKEGYADGMNITVSKEDRRASLLAYIKRELGMPAGFELAQLFDNPAAFASLKGKPEDAFGMYKFQVVDAQENGQSVPAVTVSTNENSKFARMGLSPMETAHMILDGQGYRRSSGVNKVGGSALDYFKQNAIGLARELKLNQPRLEAIDIAVEQLAAIYAQANAIYEQKLPEAKENEAIATLVESHKELLGNVASPYFLPGNNVNPRPGIKPAEAALPENHMPHTAREKFQRAQALVEAGQTQRTK